MLFLLPWLLAAQVPQALEFQGVARDATGNVLSAQSVALRLSILSGSPAGTVVYQESHQVVTSPIGLFNVKIGQGSPLSGAFNNIDWAGAAHYLKVELDNTGGSNFQDMGTTQFLSVPYAFVSGNSLKCFSVSMLGDTLFQGNGCFVIIPGISAANGGCADSDQDGFYDQAGCGTPIDCDDGDPAVYPGGIETCDGSDNDCDGSIDEETSISDPQNCGSCGVVCPQPPNTIALCVNGTCSFMCLADYADCDGDPGNGCETYLPGNNAHCGGCNIMCPVGTVCVNGNCVVCNDNDLDGFTTCDGDCDDTDPNFNPGTFDDCNGNDNNCDGIIGNNLDQDADGITSCGGDCDDFNSQIWPGATEFCDGLDNDCDGLVDEGGVCSSTCTDGILNGQETGVDCGGPSCPPCQNCFDNDSDGFTTCNGDCNDSNFNIRPGAQELCNGIDDDCDGQIDEGFGTITCGTGACQVTISACANGQIQNCVPNTPSIEVCDGIDNDCDGMVDEGNVCSSSCTDGIQNNGETGVDCGGPNCPPCSQGQGCLSSNDCGPGLICQGGICVVVTCPPGMFDCDGQSFNGCEVDTQTDPQNCGGCGMVCPQPPNTVVTCTNGACSFFCSTGFGDCDNDMNNGCETFLSSNSNCGACGVICPNGFTCQNGTCVQNCTDNDQDGFTTCNGDCNDSNAAIKPSAQEICNGVDDDCDGQIDEGLGTITCGTGACQVTISACANGQPQMCVPGNSSPEVCDGIDNDCDGMVDEGGVCAATCTDGIQNGQETGVDCGGPICQPCGGGQGCLNNGDCAPGFVCQSGICVATCPPAGTPCDDGNSCTTNDLTDGACGCTGTPIVCNDGNPCTFDQCVNGTCVFSTSPNGTSCPTGICQNGICVQNCTDNDLDGFTTCNGDCNDANPAIRPSAIEQCDGIDNDCDGQIDEGNPSGGGSCNTGMLGVCSQGVIVCSNGTLTCQPINSPSAEICDGLDNDCDGQVDEGVSCALPNAITACQAGTCVIIQCQTGFSNCDGLTFNGCETTGSCIPQN
jgi:hypothetical protein